MGYRASSVAGFVSGRTGRSAGRSGTGPRDRYVRMTQGFNREPRLNVRQVMMGGGQATSRIARIIGRLRGRAGRGHAVRGHAARGRIARAVAAVPLTARGAAVVALSSLALWPFGFGSLDLVLFLVGLLGLTLTALSLMLTVSGGLYLGRQEAEASEGLRAESGSLQATGFSLPRLGRWPLIEVDWRWREPRGVRVRPRPRGARLTEEIVSEGRALADRVTRRIAVFDVFGLTRFGFTREQPVPILILPRLGRLRAAPLVRALASADGIAHPSGTPDGDRMEIRRYAPGDSVRHIMWKTYARTRELNVRLPERSVDRARKTVAYLIAGPEDEPAAAAARAAIESGALGEGWLFAADGTPEPTSEVEAALVAIARSRAARDEATELGAFLERVSPRGDAHCIVFAPAVSADWTGIATRLATERPGSVSFVLATDGVSRPVHRAWWRRLLLAAPPAVGTPFAALGQLVRTLASSGAEVQVVDRRTGKHFGEAQTARLPRTVAA